jgi:L-glutamine:2-deoxy-scyllo-inosose/3-amino-2,3-dideoxy-scyllo-inosose aminotransferase
VRRGNVEIIDAILKKSGTAQILKANPKISERVYWRCVVDFDEEVSDEAVEKISCHFSSNYNIPFERLDRPLNNNPLYRPEKVERNQYYKHYAALSCESYDLTGADHFYKRTMAFPHQVLLQKKDWIIEFANEITRVLK